MATQGAPDAAPADWYQDPGGVHQYRYWDGTKWTDYVGDDGQQSTDPLRENGVAGTGFLDERDIAPLVRYGLVRRALPESNDNGYVTTQDGARYIDGMLCSRRFCDEHPSSYDDLTSVSRGRMISLVSANLTALSYIYLGQYAEFIVESSKEEGPDDCVEAALQTTAGYFSHAVRHYVEDGDMEKAVRVFGEYQDGLSKIDNDTARFIHTLLGSWPDHIGIAIEALSPDVPRISAGA